MGGRGNGGGGHGHGASAPDGKNGTRERRAGDASPGGMRQAFWVRLRELACQREESAVEWDENGCTCLKEEAGRRSSKESLCIDELSSSMVACIAERYGTSQNPMGVAAVISLLFFDISVWRLTVPLEPRGLADVYSSSLNQLTH